MAKLIVKALMRIGIAASIALFGFCIMIISTMGPAFLPEVYDGRLDMILRLSLLAGGVLLIIGSAVCLLAPIIKKLIATKKHSSKH